MDGVFACPDCGSEIRLKGLSPGRRVHCEWCEALVEVPYIPRAEQITRKRSGRASRRRKRWPAWANVGVTILTAAIALALLGRVFRGRWVSAQCEALSRLVESSRQAEEAGRLDKALAEIEAAVALGRNLTPPPPDFEKLMSHRANVSRREAEARLEQLAAFQPRDDSDPRLSLGQALTLRARAEKDAALAGMQDPIERTLEQLRLRWTAADCAAVKTALGACHPEQAMSRCVRMHATAAGLADPARKPIQAEARDLAERIIAQHGVIVEPATGTFTLGTSKSYSAMLSPLLVSALIKRRYLPRTAATPWDDLWPSRAPFRVTLVITENQDDTYLTTTNRVTRLDSKLSLMSGRRTIWSEAPNARTEVPLPGLPAMQASRLASSDHRSADFEELLYKNARDNLMGRLGINLQTLPECRP